MNRAFRIIKRRLTRVINNILLNSIAASNVLPEKARNFLYRLQGMEIKKARILPGATFEGYSLKDVKIESGVFINYGCFFSCNAPLIIEKNCTVAFEVAFCTSTHDIGDVQQRAGKAIGKPIRVCSGTWIGARATILPGVTIGESCIIAAGSVVTKDCEPNGLYAGSPARRIKELSQ